MDLFAHPLIRSLLVPLLLGLAGAALLRGVLGAARGARWAALAVGLGVLGGMALLLPWRWPAATLLEKLPWCAAAAWALGAGIEAVSAPRRVSWVAGTLAWLALSWWIGTGHPLLGLACAVVGAGLLAALVQTGDARATAPAGLAIASIGLGVTAFAAGSLLLMQLALALAAAIGGVALWLWPRARIRFGFGAATTCTLVWLVLAQATALLTPAPRGALLLLAIGAAAAPAAARLRLSAARAVWAEPLIAALIAAVFAAAAIGWTTLAAGSGAADDPYYQPAWD